MMEYTIIPFEAGHLEAIPRRDEICEAEVELIRLKKLPLIWQFFPSETIMVGQKIIFSVGIVPLWPGLGEAWLITPPDAKSYGEIIYKEVGEFISRNMKELHLRRLQASVNSDFLIAQKFVENLGFRQEGLLRKFIGEHDYFMYALIAEDNQ